MLRIDADLTEMKDLVKRVRTHYLSIQNDLDRVPSAASKNRGGNFSRPRTDLDRCPFESKLGSIALF